MDCDLKQWKNQLQQYQSEAQQAPAKIPRLLLEQPPSPATAALPLFVPEPNNRISSLSAFSDSTTPPTRFSGGMGCVFTSAQWHELEVQALIFKHFLAGIPVPHDLLFPIKRSFLNISASPPVASASASASACYLNPYQQHQQYQQYQHYQPAMLQSGYWGRNAVDPEPGRCRRTDGKKWRCSREIVPGHKYCERHVHRGRNRSRKLVESPTPTATEGDLKLKASNPATDLPVTAAGGTQFNVPAPPSSTNFVQVNQSSKISENIGGNVGLLDIQNGNNPGEGESDRQLLRQFFDDWPRSNQELNGVGRSGVSDARLSISTGNSSDFGLKLSTGNGDEPEYQGGNVRGMQSQLDWGAGWNGQQVGSMGGPLAEALRSSTSNASPTSVLYELNRGTTSETSSLST